MKQICIKRCQLRIDGRAVVVNKDSVIEYESIHPCLKPLESKKKPDFDNDSREVLEELKWTNKELKDYIENTYQIKVKKNLNKKQLLDKLMDARYRAV